jgi:hypothetical protein
MDTNKHECTTNNDEIRMTKLEGMTNDQMTTDCDVASSPFGLGASFVIRHSCFVISCGFSVFGSCIGFAALGGATKALW